MRKTLFILLLLSASKFSTYGQVRLTQDAELEKQLYESGLIHQPLPLNTGNSFEANGWKKEVLQSDTLPLSESLKLQFPTYTGKRATGSPSDPDYATYGNSSVAYQLNGANLERYNRIVFSIYPDCDGARVVNVNLTLSLIHI